MEKLIYKQVCPMVQKKIVDGDLGLKQELSSKQNSAICPIVTIALFKSKIMREPILVDEKSLRPISMLDSEIGTVRQWHCRVCHHNWLPRSFKVPRRCANATCKSIKWNKWPADSKPGDPSCIECMFLFKKEKEQEASRQNQDNDLATVRKIANRK